MTQTTEQLFSLRNLRILGRPGAIIETRSDGRHAGCWVRMENGWVVSVQWGIGNYSDNYNKSSDAKPEDSATAEIAVWRDDDKDDMLHWGLDEWGDSVQGYCSMSFVQRVLDAAHEDRLTQTYTPPPPPQPESELRVVVERGEDE